jgi:hypothetical protein
MRYRSAAMAEFMRSLRTLKALQAERAREHAAGAQVVELPPRQPRAPARLAPRAAAHPKAAHRCAPNEPERLMTYTLPEPPIAGPRPARGPRARNPERTRHAERTRTGASACADLAGRAARGDPYERRRAHTIGKGRRRAPDSAW